jgi:cold-inducible RNA-binding protein
LLAVKQRLLLAGFVRLLEFLPLINKFAILPPRLTVRQLRLLRRPIRLCLRRSQQTQIAQSEAIRLKNIFVGNLDFNTSEEELRQLFEPYGQVDRVSILTDRDTGRSRGFGFVEMSSSEDGEKAIAALNGSQVGGRTLNVNEARPKAERAGSGGGRDRGGRGGGGRNRW